MRVLGRLLGKLLQHIASQIAQFCWCIPLLEHVLEKRQMLLYLVIILAIIL